MEHPKPKDGDAEPEERWVVELQEVGKPRDGERAAGGELVPVGRAHDQSILIEVMAGLEVRDGGDWADVQFGSRRPVFIDDTPLFVPDIRDHIALYRLFGRPKDLARVEQLERLIA